MSLENIQQNLGTYLEREMARLNVPGAAIGILHDDDEVLITRGVTNVEHPLEVDAHTLFQVGSRTKTFTATALMRQVEEGRLDLDAPLVSYLPDFSLGTVGYAERVTARHLLTHTGGWLGDYLLVSPVPGRGEDTLARVVKSICEAPCLTPPGEVFSYNNTGFSIAGRLLEVLTGTTYEDAIREQILEPLQMDHTVFFADEAISERTASGHIVRSGKPAVARPWGISRCSHPAGAVVSDTRDQLRYARFHLGNGTAPTGKRILLAATLAEMQREHVPAGSLCDAVGLAWLLSNVGDTRTVGHSGGMNGQISAFTMVPEQQFAITVMTNADTGAVLSKHVVSWTLEHVLGITESAPTPLERDADLLDEYVGVYAFGIVRIARKGMHLVVTRQGIPGSELMEETPPPGRLLFYEHDKVVGLDEPSAGDRGEFLRGDDGQITFFRWGGRILPRYSINE